MSSMFASCCPSTAREGILTKGNIIQTIQKSLLVVDSQNLEGKKSKEMGVRTRKEGRLERQRRQRRFLGQKPKKSSRERQQPLERDGIAKRARVERARSQHLQRDEERESSNLDLVRSSLFFPSLSALPPSHHF